MIKILADSSSSGALNTGYTTEGIVLIIGSIGALVTGVMAAWFTGSTKSSTLKHQQKMEEMATLAALDAGAAKNQIYACRKERERQ